MATKNSLKTSSAQDPGNELQALSTRLAQVLAHAGPDGGLTLADDFWVEFPDGYRAHQIRLEGGDCSTDSFCYPSVGR